MNVISKISDSSERYARCIQTSKRVRWDIDKDVIRGRNFDTAHKFLPDGLSLADAFTTLSADEKRFVSQIQGRTYANIFGLVERFINAKVLELSRGPLVRRSGCARGAGTVQRRGVKTPGAVPPRRRDGRRGSARRLSLRRRSQCRRPCRARQKHLGGVGADAGYRAVHSAPLSPEHRLRSPALRAVQGRVPLSLEGGKPARDPRRTRVGAPRRRANGGGTRFGGRRVHRVGRRGGRNPAGPGQSRRGLLHGNLRPRGSARRRRARSRPHSSRPIAGNTSIPAPSTRTSARCSPA